MSEENLNFLREQVRDLQRKNEDLVKDNGGYRDQIRDLTRERDEANTKVTDLEKAQPKEGQRVLTKAETERFEALMALGDEGEKGDPAKLKERLDKAGEYRTEARQLKRDALISEAAGSTYNRKALAAHLPENATLETKTVTADGKEAKVYELVDGDTRTTLEDWVKAQEQERDYVQFRVAPQERKQVYTGPGSAGGKAVDAVDAYNQQTYGAKKTT